MDGDSLGKVISIIIAVLFMVFAPVMLVTLKTEDAMQSFVQSQAVEFVDLSRSTGCISPDNYLTFVNTIGSTGSYDVQIEHRSKLAFPDEEHFQQTGEKSYIVGQRAYYRDEILGHMFGSGQDENYLMKNGDYLSITVTSKGNGVTNGFMRFFTGHAGNGITVTYGGYVGNTGEG